MELIIDFDGIDDSGKKDWLLRTLKLMNINYQTAEKPQTVEAYNNELAEGETEIDKGDFKTHEQLKKEIKSWL